MSGSFNPLHDGHRLLFSALSRRLPGQLCAYGLSVANADKGLLSEAEVARRLRAFIGESAVALVTAPRYIDMNRLMPGAHFVMGYDTAERLVDPKYYQEPVPIALGDLLRDNCKIYVAGRYKDTGMFMQLGDLTMPPELASLFESVPQAEVCLKLSSTDLRMKAEQSITRS